MIDYFYSKCHPTGVCAITPVIIDFMHPEPQSFVLGCVNLLNILVSVRKFFKINDQKKTPIAKY
jgi:hypothetical protein